MSYIAGIVATDAYRDNIDSSNKPFRVAYQIESGAWIFLKDKNGNVRRFGSLRAACGVARTLEVS